MRKPLFVGILVGILGILVGCGSQAPQTRAAPLPTVAAPAKTSEVKAPETLEGRRGRCVKAYERAVDLSFRRRMAENPPVENATPQEIEALKVRWKRIMGQRVMVNFYAACLGQLTPEQVDCAINSNDIKALEVCVDAQDDDE